MTICKGGFQTVGICFGQKTWERNCFFGILCLPLPYVMDLLSVVRAVLRRVVAPGSRRHLDTCILPDCLLFINAESMLNVKVIACVP